MTIYFGAMNLLVGTKSQMDLALNSFENKAKRSDTPHAILKLGSIVPKNKLSDLFSKGVVDEAELSKLKKAFPQRDMNTIKKHLLGSGLDTTDKKQACIVYSGEDAKRIKPYIEGLSNYFVKANELYSQIMESKTDIIDAISPEAKRLKSSSYSQGLLKLIITDQSLLKSFTSKDPTEKKRARKAVQSAIQKEANLNPEFDQKIQALIALKNKFSKEQSLLKDKTFITELKTALTELVDTPNIQKRMTPEGKAIVAVLINNIAKTMNIYANMSTGSATIEDLIKLLPSPISAEEFLSRIETKDFSQTKSGESHVDFVNTLPIKAMILVSSAMPQFRKLLDGAKKKAATMTGGLFNINLN